MQEKSGREQRCQAEELSTLPAAGSIALAVNPRCSARTTRSTDQKTITRPKPSTDPASHHERAPSIRTLRSLVAAPIMFEARNR